MKRPSYKDGERTETAPRVVVPIAKRTRRALKASWQEHHELFKLRRQLARNAANVPLLTLGNSAVDKAAPFEGEDKSKEKEFDGQRDEFDDLDHQTKEAKKNDQFANSEQKIDEAQNVQIETVDSTVEENDLQKDVPGTSEDHSEGLKANVCNGKSKQRARKRNRDTRAKKRKEKATAKIKSRAAEYEAAKSLFENFLSSIAEEAKLPSTCQNTFDCRSLSAEDVEMEEMWRDMQLALKGCESALMSSRNCVYDSDNSIDDNTSFMCADDDHEFVIDEEIGLLCRTCRFVKQEIRGILPSLELGTKKRQNLHDYDSEGSSDFRQSHLEEEIMEESTYDDHHYSEQSVWDIIPDLKENMYPHQQEGFEFLWRNLAGSLIPEEMKPPTSEEVGGCIISHAPGTGKSFLMISFLKTYLELYPRSRPLLVAPYNMLCSWEREFYKWGINLPFHILNRSKLFWEELCSTKEHPDIIDFSKFRDLKKTHLKNLYRIMMIKEWYRRPSVMAVSYNLFLHLTSPENHCMLEVKRIGQLLLESPGILILDEGHQVRNDRSKIWRSFQNVKTKLRIILSGTLFQNNFKELFNTLYLVRPSFILKCMGKNIKERENVPVKGESEMPYMSNEAQKAQRRLFMEEIGKKIHNGDEEIQETLAKFRHMTNDFVHCYKGKVLDRLPGLRDFAVILRPSAMQQVILNYVTEENNIRKLSNFEFETVTSMICIHPCLAKEFNCKRLSSLPPTESKKRDVFQSFKIKFVVDLIELATIMKEKVLLFSQNIPPLSYIAEMLQTKLSLCKGTEVLQLDGSLAMDERQVIIDRFNNPHDPAKVLLASIRACSEGISLTGASRLVFLDLVWNPSVIKQAVSRAFRLGQKKHVYVYRLLLAGTFEEEKYKKTAWKDCLSELVFSSNELKIDANNGYHEMAHQQDSRKRIGSEDKILDKLLEMDKECNAFHSIFEHTENKRGNGTRTKYMQNYFSGYYSCHHPSFTPSVLFFG